jgi:hypothetical protein
VDGIVREQVAFDGVTEDTVKDGGIQHDTAAAAGERLFCYARQLPRLESSITARVISSRLVSARPSRNSPKALQVLLVACAR